jgi:hypothetical protein
MNCFYSSNGDYICFDKVENFTSKFSCVCPNGLVNGSKDKCASQEFVPDKGIICIPGITKCFCDSNRTAKKTEEPQKTQESHTYAQNIARQAHKIKMKEYNNIISEIEKIDKQAQIDMKIINNIKQITLTESEIKYKTRSQEEIKIAKEKLQTITNESLTALTEVANIIKIRQNITQIATSYAKLQTLEVIVKLIDEATKSASIIKTSKDKVIEISKKA